MDTKYFVHADWDDEAECWYVSDTNIPGLATGAETIPELMKKLSIMVAELLSFREPMPDPTYFEFLASYKTQLRAVT